MRCLLAAVAALAIVLPRATAQEGNKPTPLQQLQQLQKDVQKRMAPIQQAFGKAKSAKEREQIRNQAMALIAEYGEKLVEFARDHEDDPSAFKALDSAFQFTSVPSIRKRVTKAVRTTILTKETSSKLQGYAALKLAQSLRTAMDESDGATRKQLVGEAKELLQLVIDKFADVEHKGVKLGQLAKQELAAIKNLSRLAIGQVAPEIEGKDSDGKPFKLSDYRGKVVVLDFWAGW